MVANLQQANDVISIANQLGRLDLVSAILASLTVVLALAAVPVFLMLRYRASEVAKKAADEALVGAVERIEREATVKVEGMLPTLVADYMQLVQNQIAAEQADQIADAQDEGPNDDNLPGDQGGAGTSS